ncbi:fumarylacetoacetate hydrolase family protein [Streptomyces sp. NBC_00448]|uniref:fumarylacetoacetate hydrolase family protein n=1 Tax=Streptomyces sp. NBC_00448 TaxID=2903652 RepID=UPI002E1F2BDE
MEIVRVRTERGASYGRVDRASGTVHLLKGETFGEIVRDLHEGVAAESGQLVLFDEEVLLAPAEPGKIIVIGRNYGGRAEEAGRLVVHLKPPTAVIGPNDPVVLPRISRDTRFEGELAVVIGRVCRDIAPEEADGAVFGYTCANDVTAWDVGSDGGQWTTAKGFDSFCPLGPSITTDLDPLHAEITTRVNGEVRQSGSTAGLVRSVHQLVAGLSALMTLLPGDVLLTGTPEGSAALHDGDVVEVGIAGVGVLRNPVSG